MSPSQSQPHKTLDSFKAIILDFDGTVVDSIDIKTRAFYETFLPYGEEVALYAQDIHLRNQGVTRVTKISRVVSDCHLPNDSELVATLAKNFATSVADQVATCSYLPGALDFVRYYTKRVNLFLVSATPGPELDLIVDRRGIAQWFASIQGFPPEKTETVAKILHDYKLLGKDVLIIGDSLSDLEASRACLTSFIGVNSTGTRWPDGTVCIPSLAHLLPNSDSTL